MFYYFPGNYTWSAGVALSMMAGGELGQIDRWLAPLRDAEPDTEAWTKAWDGAATQQEDLAAGDLRLGFRRSASARYLRASTYYLTGDEPGCSGLLGLGGGVEERGGCGPGRGGCGGVMVHPRGQARAVVQQVQLPGQGVRVGTQVVADTTRALTLREASYPPVQYIPLQDVDQTLLTASAYEAVADIAGHVAFYTDQVDIVVGT
ncbi:MAG TPA: DUF427 domain-containing protein [Trebonia sp.]